MVVYATAMPTQSGDVCHGQEIPAGYAKVIVKKVCNDWKMLELDISGGDWKRTLVEVIHCYILWDKCYIILKPTKEASRLVSPERAPSMSPPSLRAASEHSLSPSSPRQPSTPASPPSPGSSPPAADKEAKTGVEVASIV